MTKNFKSILLIICLVSATVSVRAGGVMYGPVLGLNLANQTSSDSDESSDIKPGLHIGALLDFYLGDNFSISPAVIYSMKGSQESVNDEIVKSNFNYLEIPLMAKYQLDNGINFSAGPYLGLLLSAKASSDGDDFDLSDFYKPTDFGFKAGVGYTLESGLGFSMNYGTSLTSISEEITIFGVTQTPDVKNSVIGISVSYMLGGN